MTVSDVTNEWLEAEIDHHDNMAAITAANGRAELSEDHDAYADALRELLSRRSADEESANRKRADFLYPPSPGSAEEAAFEFVNAATEEYRKEWWEILRARFRAADEGAVTVPLVGVDFDPEQNEIDGLKGDEQLWSLLVKQIPGQSFGAGDTVTIRRRP